MPLRLGGTLESFRVQRRGITGGDDPLIICKGDGEPVRGLTVAKGEQMRV
jgi:hypothetical protein